MAPGLVWQLNCVSKDQVLHIFSGLPSQHCGAFALPSWPKMAAITLGITSSYGEGEEADRGRDREQNKSLSQNALGQN
jgi:hypothetical protein